MEWSIEVYTFLTVFWKQFLCSSIEAWMNSWMWSLTSSRKVASSFFFFRHEVSGSFSFELFSIDILWSLLDYLHPKKIKSYNISIAIEYHLKDVHNAKACGNLEFKFHCYSIMKIMHMSRSYYYNHVACTSFFTSLYTLLHMA